MMDDREVIDRENLDIPDLTGEDDAEANGDAGGMYAGLGEAAYDLPDEDEEAVPDWWDDDEDW